MFFLFFRDSSIRFRSAEGWITHTQRSIKFLLTRFYVKILVSSLPFTHHELMPNSQFGARVFIMTLTRWASQKVKRAAARRRLAIRRSRDTKDRCQTPSRPDLRPRVSRFASIWHAIMSGPEVRWGRRSNVPWKNAAFPRDAGYLSPRA